MTQLWRLATDALVGAAGGNKAALGRAPTARSAFVALGMTVLVTSGVAVLSAWYAFNDALDVPALTAVLPALAWGLVIFTLDRMLITVGMANSTTATLGTSAARLAVAVLLGAVVSTPLTLKAFDKDINYELGVMRLENAKKIQGQIDDFKTGTVDVIHHDINVQQNILAGSLPEGMDTSNSAQVTAAIKAVEALRPELDAAAHTAEQAAILVSCEGYGNGREQLDHPEKCAAKPGKNGNYNLYVKQSQGAAARSAKIQDKMDAAQTRLAASRKAQGQAQGAVLTDLQDAAPEELARLAKKMAAAQAVLTDLQSQLDDVNAGNDGLLAQLEALGRVGEKDATLRWAHLLLALLFIAIEMAPVLGKTLFVFTKRYGAYEQALALQEATDLNLFHGEVTSSQELAEQQRRLDLEMEKARIEAAVAEAKSQGEVAIAREETRRRLEIARNDRLEKEYSDRIEQVMREQGHRELDAWEAGLP